MSYDERGRCPEPDVWEGMSSGGNVRFPSLQRPKCWQIFTELNKSIADDIKTDTYQSPNCIRKTKNKISW